MPRALGRLSPIDCDTVVTHLDAAQSVLMSPKRLADGVERIERIITAVVGEGIIDALNAARSGNAADAICQLENFRTSLKLDALTDDGDW